MRSVSRGRQDYVDDGMELTVEEEFIAVTSMYGETEFESKIRSSSQSSVNEIGCPLRW